MEPPTVLRRVVHDQPGMISMLNNDPSEKEFQWLN
jgi:hypothetical protein